MLNSHRSAYIAFDIYPSSKGAATHISHMADQLFDSFDGGALITLGNKNFAEHELEGTVTAHRFTSQIPNYLDRAQAFSGFVKQKLDSMEHLEIAHFRDIWSALGVYNSNKSCHTIFEVNGLASIELPYHYPSLSQSLLAKLEKIETECLIKADQIIVPSHIIAASLINKGINDNKINIIPNGATVPKNTLIATEDLGDYIIYFGAVQPWQGLEVLFRSVALLKDLNNTRLLVCSASKPKQTKELKRLARRLGIESQIIWKYQLKKPELYTYIQNAKLSVAPLTECSRNISQGCSPLKIFESMACGTAVIASRIPAVEEILENDISGKLVRADRPQELARAIRLMLEYPDKRKVLEKNAKQLIQNKFNWVQIRQQLEQVYKRLGSNTVITSQ